MPDRRGKARHRPRRLLWTGRRGVDRCAVGSLRPQAVRHSVLGVRKHRSARWVVEPCQVRRYWCGPQPSRRPSLELARRKNTTARAAVRLLSGVSPQTPMLSTRNDARPVPEGHSLAEYSGVRQGSELRPQQAAEASIFPRLPQSLAPSARQPASCGKPGSITTAGSGSGHDPADRHKVRGATTNLGLAPAQRVASAAETVFSWRVSERE